MLDCITLMKQGDNWCLADTAKTELPDKTGFNEALDQEGWGLNNFTKTRPAFTFIL